MLFVVEIRDYSYETRCRVFDLRTDTMFQTDLDTLGKLYNKGVQIINADISNGALKIDSNKYGNFEKSLLVAVIDNSKFVIVRPNGNIMSKSEEALIELVKAGEVANCSIRGNKVVHNKVYKINTNNELKRRVEEDYERFIKKSLTLGMDIGFEYEVVGDLVRLTKYTGTDRSTIVPPFITDISRGAFYTSNIIENISLGGGIKTIGPDALGRSVKKIDVPSNVNYIHQNIAMKHIVRYNLKSNDTIVL